MNLQITGLKVDGGGEGSRGGHVIGHTSSGKPIYSSNKGPAPSPEHHAKLKEVAMEDIGKFGDTSGLKSLADHFSRAHIPLDVGKLKKRAVEMIDYSATKKAEKPEWHHGGIDHMAKQVRDHLSAQQGSRVGAETRVQRIERGIKSGMVSGRRHR